MLAFLWLNANKDKNLNEKKQARVEELPDDASSDSTLSTVASLTPQTKPTKPAATATQSIANFVREYSGPGHLATPPVENQVERRARLREERKKRNGRDGEKAVRGRKAGRKAEWRGRMKV